MEYLKFRVFIEAEDEQDAGLYNVSSLFWHNGDQYVSWMSATCEAKVADVVVEQQTGAKDDNGDFIYEGDIVEFTNWWFDGNERESILTGTIVYSNDLMSFQLQGVKNEEWERHTGHEGDEDYFTPFSELNFDQADFKVIGNIHGAKPL